MITLLKKTTLLLTASFLLLSNIALANEPGSISFNNSGRNVGSHEAIYLRIDAPEINRTQYLDNIEVGEEKIISSKNFRGATFINVSISGESLRSTKCLLKLTIGSDWKPQYIFAWVKNEEFQCARGSNKIV